MIRHAIHLSWILALLGASAGVGGGSVRVGSPELAATERIIEAEEGDLLEVLGIEVGPDISFELIDAAGRRLLPITRITAVGVEVAVFRIPAKEEVRLRSKSPVKIAAAGFVLIEPRLHPGALGAAGERLGAWSLLGAPGDPESAPGQRASRLEAARVIFEGLAEPELTRLLTLVACENHLEHGDAASARDLAAGEWARRGSLADGDPTVAMIAGTIDGGLLLCLGDGLAELGAAKEAIEIYGESRQRFQQAGHPVGVASATLEMAITLEDLGRPAGERLPMILEASSVFESHGAWALLATTLSAAGLAFEELGETDEASIAYERALDLRPPDAVWGKAVTHNNLARLLLSEGDFRGAQHHYLKAIELALATGKDQHLDILHSNLGVVYRRMGMLDRARTHYEEALRRREVRASSKPMDLSITLQNLSLVEREEKHFGRAEELLRRAVQLQERGAGLLLPETAENLGRVLLDRGRLAEAREWLERSLASYRSRGHPLGEARVLAGLGLAASARGDHAKAVDLFDRALGQVEPISQDQVAAMSYGKARVLQKAGRYREALDWAHQAATLRTQQHWAFNGTGLQSPFFHSSLPQLRLETSLWLSIWEQGGAPEAAVEAFEAYELHRGQSVAELLVGGGTPLRTGLDDATIERERLLVRSLDRAEHRRRRARQSGQHLPPDQVNELAELQRDYELLQVRIAEKVPERNRLLSPTTVGVAGLQSLLGDDTVLIVYFLGEETSYSWVVTRDGFHLYGLGPTQRIADLASALTTTLALQGGAATTRGSLALFAQELGGLLLAPMAGEGLLPGKRWLIVPDGLLHDMPFELLEVEKGGPLVQNKSITYLPSATTLSVLADRELPAPIRQLAVYGDPVTHPRDPRLAVVPDVASATDDPWRLAPFERIPTAESEARAIADGVVPGERHVALGFAATREDFLATAGSARVLHLSAHGVLDEDTPILSGLALTRYAEDGTPIDGDLLLLDLYEVRLAADLVVLSSCESARNGPGAGAIGSVAHAFLHAGARRVIGSLWPVRGEATTTLLRQFYEYYWAGELPSRALQLAKQDLRASERWSHPYFWAGFVLYGAP